MLFLNHVFLKKKKIPASIAEAAALIPNGAKIFFGKETATFINRPAILLNNDPRYPLDWIF